MLRLTEKGVFLMRAPFTNPAITYFMAAWLAHALPGYWKTVNASQCMTQAATVTAFWCACDHQNGFEFTPACAVRA